MTTNEEIEAYLLEAGREFTSAEENLWIVYGDDHLENIVLILTAPVVTFRVKLMEMPHSERRAQLCERLLQLNASEMVAGAFGIEDDNVVITDTLQAENLDMNELVASIDGLSLAVSMYYNELSQYRDTGAGGLGGDQDAQLAAFDAQLAAAAE